MGTFFGMHFKFDEYKFACWNVVVECSCNVQNGVWKHLISNCLYERILNDNEKTKDYLEATTRINFCDLRIQVEFRELQIFACCSEYIINAVMNKFN